MQERFIDGSERLSESVEAKEAKKRFRAMFDGGLDAPRMVALHAPGSIITTEGVTTVRRRDGTEETLPPGRYLVKADGALVLAP